MERDQLFKPRGDGGIDRSLTLDPAADGGSVLTRSARQFMHGPSENEERPAQTIRRGFVPIMGTRRRLSICGRAAIICDFPVRVEMYVSVHGARMRRPDANGMG